LEEVDSELVVPADHFHVHHHPLAILELRRILLQHLQEADRSADIVPVSHTKPSGAIEGTSSTKLQR
jgi:hypothetical protein